MASSVSDDQTLIGAAVFGGGRMGTVHLKSLCNNRQKYRVFFCVDVFVARAQEMAAEAGPQCTGTDDIDAAMTDPRVQCVIICTPTPTHVPLIEQALNNNKHVFCEKPVSLDHREVSRLFNLAKSKSLTLYCAYQRRADDSYRKLKQNIVDGKIGNVQIIKSTSRDHPGPSIEFLKTSCGFFHDCAVHDIDLLCWVAGERPSRVYATGHAFDPAIGEIGDFDTVTISLEFPSGILGICDVSRFAAYGYDQRLEVHGSLGMVQTENRLQTSCIVSTKAGLTHDNPHWSFPQRYAEAYARETDHFYDVIQNKVEPWLNGRDCATIAQVADAAELSAKTHQPVVMVYDN